MLRDADTASEANEVFIDAYVHLGYGFGANEYRSRYAAGLVPDVTPYGLHHAEQMNCRVSYSVDHRESKLSEWHRRAWNKLLGFDVVHAYRNREKLGSVDVVWTMEERQYLAAIVIGLAMPRFAARKLIAQTVWLFDDWQKKSPLRRWFLGKLLEHADVLTVHSNRYLFQKELSSFPLHLLPFGISLDSFPFSSKIRECHSPLHILAMGNDRTRDWPTFLEAFGNDDRFEVIVISQFLTAVAVAKYQNVTKVERPRMDDFRDCYEWADFVVVPMEPNLYSGITVALEATSMGVPVISSATGGVDTYFDRTQVLYAPPFDPEALQLCALSCGRDERISLVENAQKRFMSENYSSSGLSARYVELSMQLLSETF